MVGPATPGPESPDGTGGRFGVGFLQPLGIYLAVVALFVAVQVVGGPGLRNHYYQQQAEAAAILGFLVCVLLGLWHQGRGRSGTATGLLVGAVMWPVIFVALFLAFAWYRISHGSFER
jgi:hypothetical protein